MQGCVEHTLVLKRLLEQARRRKVAAHLIWIDIANAFGSVPHDVFNLALESVHAPHWFRSYMANFYSDITVIGNTTNFKTDPIKIKVGVFQGDTISPTLFVLVFNQVLKYLDTERDHGLLLNQE